ncbi:MAG: glycosyltransferase family 39 protein [Candidatus Omnitrophica bacterium]|nr:glycosyltransferase family 39 protein [Candidatus Omnitrophota bacterium]
MYRFYRTITFINRWFNKPLVLILILGFLLRGIGLLLNKNLQFDEAVVWYTSTSVSFFDLLSGKYSPFAHHPPLYYLFMHVWSRISDSEIWLRSPSLLAGVGSTYLIFLIIKESGSSSKRKAIITTLLFSTSSYHIFWSIQARVYEILIFFTLLYIYLFLETIKKSGGILWYFLFITGIFIFFIDYSFFWAYLTIHAFYITYLFIGKGVHLNIDSQINIKKSIKFWLLVNIPTLIIFIYLFFIIYHLNVRNLAPLRWINKPDFNSVISLLKLYISGYYYLVNYLAPSIKFLYSISLDILVTFILISSVKLLLKRDLFPIFLLFIPILCSFLISQFIPIFIDYHIMFASIGIILVFGWGLFYFQKFSYLIVFLWLLTNFLFLNMNYKSASIEDWTTAALFLKNNTNETYKIIFYPSFFNTPFYYYNKQFKIFTNEDYEIRSTSLGQERKIISNIYKSEINHCIIVRNIDIIQRNKPLQRELQNRYTLKSKEISGIDIFCTQFFRRNFL